MKHSAASVAALRASLARVSAHAAELMIAHDDWSVTVCLNQAMAEDYLLYGAPGSTDGLLGETMQGLRQKYQS